VSGEIRSEFMVTDDDTTGLPDVSVREALRITMQEIADVYADLKKDNQQLNQKIDRVASDMQSMKKELQSDIHTLRLEVHQNQTAFMTNHTSLEKRVTTLEMAA
jgi:uncharacterized protein YaaN involved in tellurite resistance